MDDPKIVEYLIKIGKVNPVVPLYITMEALSDIYGWTPDQIESQDPEIMDIYLAILSGKQEAKNKAMGNRKTKKELKGLG